MTSKLIRQKTPAGVKEKFPEFPPRDDMQNFLHLNRPGYPTALDRHFGLSDSTVVMCEAPLRWRPGQRRGHRIPDLLIAFNVDRAAATFQMGYSISEQGKPPDFVLEVASSSTGEKDYEEKRDAYAKFRRPRVLAFRLLRGRQSRRAPGRRPAGGRRVSTY